MKSFRLVLVLIGIGLLTAAALWYSKESRGMFGPSTTEFQAVFLTNGQVYFGKLKEAGKTVTLSEIYYLQVQQPIQPAKEGEQPDVKLVKLGSEVHGPEDRMRINKDQILFVESLKENGKVVDAIRRYQRGDTSSVTTE
ncbi:hypothetical protein HY374_01055 [Candidatus Berkelbacteria bacterium]|nr:hypothetical protein [Candidatus Berkelbacteria bacterium]